MLEEVRSLRPAERFWTPQEVSGGKAPLLPPSGTMGWGDREARGQCVGLWLTLLPGPQGPRAPHCGVSLDSNQSWPRWEQSHEHP